MGSKKINGPFQIPWAALITGPWTNNIQNPAANTGVMASTNTIYCQPQNIQNFDTAMIQFSWTGTPTGTIIVSQSADQLIWDDLILSPTITQPAGGAGHWSVNIQPTGAPWIQARYTNASGTGVLTAKIFQKDWN